MVKVIFKIIAVSCLYLLIFLQFPLNNSLTGALDTIANLAMYKEVALKISCFFNGSVYTTVCYPAQSTWLFMGADFGAGIIHLFYGLLGFNDIWANYLFISTLFTLNTLALWLLLRYITGSSWIGLAGALIFNLSQFTLANLENPNTLVFFLSFLSMYFFARYSDVGFKHNRFFLLSTLTGAIMIYLSPYNFLLHAIILTCFIAYHLAGRNTSIKLRELVIMGLIYFVIVFPYLWVFVFGNDDIRNAYNVVVEQGAIHALSMNIEDYFRVLPNHLYLKHQDFESYPWLVNIKSAFPGIVFIVLAVIGIRRRSRFRLFALLLVIAGVIVATGPEVSLHFKPLFPSFMYPFYKYFDLAGILRVPFRAYFISMLGLTFLVCSGLAWVAERRRGIHIASLAVLLVLVENIPIPFQTYGNDLSGSMDRKILNELKFGSEDVVLNLPSDLFSYDADRREYKYMYWHHLYNKNTLNGYMAFMPEVRMRTQRLINSGSPASLDSLFLDYGVTKVVFHEDLVLNDEELQQLDYLRLSPYLVETAHSGQVHLFKVDYSDLLN